MLRHSYDNWKINHTISQVENLLQTYDWSYDNRRTNLKIFCKSGPRFIWCDTFFIWLLFFLSTSAHFYITSLHDK